jgi:hypothetical protein
LKLGDKKGECLEKRKKERKKEGHWHTQPSGFVEVMVEVMWEPTTKVRGPIVDLSNFMDNYDRWIELRLSPRVRDCKPNMLSFSSFKIGLEMQRLKEVKKKKKNCGLRRRPK